MQTVAVARVPARRGLWGWALFDWANSPYTTLIITFVIPAYFGKGIVGDEVVGQSLWGWTIAVSAFAIALLSPVLGAIADAAGRRKPWLAFFTGLCIIGSALLWFAEPSAAWIAWAMIWVAISNIGFEFGMVFYNAMLPDLAPPHRLGRLSGWAWGLGYAGGLSALALALFGFIQTETPLFGLTTAGAENVRIVGPMVALWLLVFAWPLFAYAPDRPRTGAPAAAAVRQGWESLVATLRGLKGFGPIPRYLLARMLYNDGLVTIFAFGGIYAAGVFGMSLAQIILFGIVLNVTAGLGAVAFGWIDDWIGPKRTVMISLIGLIAAAGGILLVERELWFWILGAGLGIFVGPSQAASRTLMARLAPAEQRTELFGLYAMSGKATAFLGPALVGTVTAATASQRWGLSVVLLLFAAGMALLATVREPSPRG